MRIAQDPSPRFSKRFPCIEVNTPTFEQGFDETKQGRLPVHPSASRQSSANQPLQQTVQPTPVPLARSVRAAAPKVNDVEPQEYMLNAFENCISRMLCMRTLMQTFIRIRLYRKMFSDLARPYSPPRILALSMSSSLAPPAALRVWALHRLHETI